MTAWLAARTTKSTLEQLLRIAWRTVGAIVTRVVADGLAVRDPLVGLTRIGIDEISYKRGHFSGDPGPSPDVPSGAGGGVSVGPSAYRARHGELCDEPAWRAAMKALRVELTDTLAYWTVVDDGWVPVPAADAYLRHLRLGADRAEGTTRVYAGDLALFLGWCAAGGRDLACGARDLHLFVGMLKTTPVQRVGSGRGAVRGPARINHVLAAVREFYCHVLGAGGVDAGVLGLLFEVGDDWDLPRELKPEGSGLRYGLGLATFSGSAAGCSRPGSRHDPAQPNRASTSSWRTLAGCTRRRTR